MQPKANVGPQTTSSLGAGRRIDEILPEVYGELRRLAARHFRHERHDHTLQPTALVHEVYLRILRDHDSSYDCHSHFLALGARAIRRTLVDHARSRSREKRGRWKKRVPLREHHSMVSIDHGLDLLDLDAALRNLAHSKPRQARVVELRYFGGLTVDEVASVLSVTSRTVSEDWRFARAWLLRDLS